MTDRFDCGFKGSEMGRGRQTRCGGLRKVNARFANATPNVPKLGRSDAPRIYLLIVGNPWRINRGNSRASPAAAASSLIREAED